MSDYWQRQREDDAMFAAREEGVTFDRSPKSVTTYRATTATPPLVTASRDALVAGLRETISPGAYDAGDIADYLLASGVVRAVDGLADNEALVEQMARPKIPPVNDSWLRGRVRDEVRRDLRALAAALATPTDPSEA